MKNKRVCAEEPAGEDAPAEGGDHTVLVLCFLILDFSAAPIALRSGNLKSAVQKHLRLERHIAQNNRCWNVGIGCTETRKLRGRSCQRDHVTGRSSRSCNRSQGEINHMMM